MQKYRKHKKEDSIVTFPKDPNSPATEVSYTETRKMSNKDLKCSWEKMTSHLKEDRNKQMSHVSKLIRTRIGKPTP